MVAGCVQYGIEALQTLLLITFAYLNIMQPMEALIHDNKVFEEITYADKLIRGREFQSCTFKKCDFSNSDFPHNKFLDCVFDGCNLSMMKFSGSTLSNVEFKNCKMLGVNFSECQDFLFSVEFDSCILDYASFMGKKMVKTTFAHSSLKEVSFSQANLNGSVFNDTNLENAVFSRTDLTGVNFTTAYNYTMDPELNILKKASFSTQGIAGLLVKYGIKIV